ncbi:hypothetical protein [Glutamicibacter sp. 2E12]|uniref:hypothetical protein n=1 Tax=Glutamicibacter sp. 2E12 TaxID=3416181 RepID=UPI003CF006DD
MLQKLAFPLAVLPAGEAVDRPNNRHDISAGLQPSAMHQGNGHRAESCPAPTKTPSRATGQQLRDPVPPGTGQNAAC